MCAIPASNLGSPTRSPTRGLTTLFAQREQHHRRMFCCRWGMAVSHPDVAIRLTCHGVTTAPPFTARPDPGHFVSAGHASRCPWGSLIPTLSLTNPPNPPPSLAGFRSPRPSTQLTVARLGASRSHRHIADGSEDATATSWLTFAGFALVKVAIMWLLRPVPFPQLFAARLSTSPHPETSATQQRSTTDQTALHYGVSA